MPNTHGILPQLVEVVHRALASAHRVGVTDGFGHVLFGRRYRFHYALSFRQLRGDGRGEGSAGAMRVPGLYTDSLELLELPAVVEQVHRGAG